LPGLPCTIFALTSRNSQFTEKAQLAADAGAIGVIFVNTKKRLFDAIGSTDGITIPVVAVAKSAAEKLVDGADLTLNLDSSFTLGSAAELERKTLAASMRIASTVGTHTATKNGAQQLTSPVGGGMLQRAGSGDSSPLTGASQTPGRASMCSQDVTEDHVSGMACRAYHDLLKARTFHELFTFALILLVST